MFAFFKRNRTLLLVAALMLLPLFVYRAHSRREAANNPLDRVVLLLTSPLERALSAATDFVSDRWYRYADLQEARAQNIELRRSLIKLEQQAAEAGTLALENERLRRLMLLDSRNPALELLAASVVAFGHSPLERTLKIDRGLVHGVRRGNPVIAEAGLVGRVQRVGFNSAEVLLIADEKVSLDVVVDRSRAKGRLRGSGLWPNYKLDLLHVQRTDDVRVGDRVATRGLGGVFPKGVPVGVVSKVGASPDGQELVVEVAPSVDLSRLEEVLVVRHTQPTGEEKATPELLLPDELKPAVTATASPPRAESRPEPPR